MVARRPARTRRALQLTPRGAVVPGIRPRISRLHVLVSERELGSPDRVGALRKMLEPGSLPAPVAFHLRARLAGRELFAATEMVRDLAARETRPGRAHPIVVNGRVDIALAAGAAAVQLGRGALPVGAVRGLVSHTRGLPSVAIGKSVHSAGEAAAAAAEGVDWVIAGHVFDTDSHSGTPGRGIGWLASVVTRAGDLPVIAIGGIVARRVDALRQTGVWGVAVSGAVWAGRDPVETVRELTAIRWPTAPDCTV